MKGYKNRSLATQQTINSDGWLHTGKYYARGTFSSFA
jgi:long-subunit acyl-CoA synthetase (AMP-forming)